MAKHEHCEIIESEFDKYCIRCGLDDAYWEKVSECPADVAKEIRTIDKLRAQISLLMARAQGLSDMIDELIAEHDLLADQKQQQPN